MADPRFSTRAEAKAAGWETFFSGVPCKYGHMDFRRTVNNTCMTCQRDQQRTRLDQTPRSRMTPPPEHDAWVMEPAPIPPWRPPVTGSASGFIPPMPLARLMAAR